MKNIFAAQFHCCVTAPIGTVTDAYITSATGEEKSYGIWGCHNGLLFVG